MTHRHDGAPGDPPVRVASFDVFDTVLTRAVADPTSVFLLLGRAVEETVGLTPADFRRERVAAEARARRAAGKDVPLDDIYRELAATLGWSRALREEVARRELDLEERLVRAVPGAAGRVAAQRGLGQRIAFLSDMYLPTGVISRWLAREGLLQPGEACHVSADTGRSKQAGDAFDALAAALEVDPGAIRHVGDNENSDVRAARAAGLRAVPFGRARLTRYERILERNAEATGGLASVLAGASRLARLHVDAADEREAAIRDVAAGVVAPTLACFTLWLQRRASAAGLRRLYFVSRDGQVLLPVARATGSAAGSELELRYLHGGRQAWHAAAIRDISTDNLGWATEARPGLSLRDVLRRLDSDSPELLDALRRFPAVPSDPDAPLSEAGRGAIADALRSPGVFERLADHAAAARERALAYLGQEGLLDGTPAGFVDIGWRGNALRSLHSILADAGASAPNGFFFGLLGPRPVGLGAPAEAFFVDRERGIRPPVPVPSLPILMETFTAGDHGQVLGYRIAPDGVEPRLAREANREVLNWGLSVVRETVSAFCSALLIAPDLVDVAADARRTVGDVLRAFWCEPTAAEVHAWGTFPYETDQAGGGFHPLAEPHAPWSVMGALRTGWISAPRTSSWPAGSLHVTPRPLRAALRGALRMRDLATRWPLGSVTDRSGRRSPERRSEEV